MSAFRHCRPAAFGAILTLIALPTSTLRAAPEQPPKGPPPEVGVVEIQAQPVMLTTELPGRAAPYRIAEVRPQVGGIIQERLFEEGGAIEIGQVLYQIDPSVYQAAFDNAQAAVERARATEERAQLHANRYSRLANTKAASQEDADDAAAALKEAIADVAVAEADLTKARINLEFTRVTSPIAGRIGRSAVTQGALVSAYQDLALATVQQLDPIYIDLSQSSAQLLHLRRALDDGHLKRDGDADPKVSLMLEDGTAYPLTGSLEFSEVTVDQDTGTVTLRASFPNPDHLLLPGMFVRATVEEGVRPDAILVPQQSVTHDRRGRPSALVVNADGVVEQRQIDTDRAMDNHWLISAGLQPGERVIVEGSQKVRPGDHAQAKDLSAQYRVTKPDAQTPSATTTD